mgnify:CR=1 FL=1
MPKTKAPSLNLCKRFENGLDEKYGMSKEDLITEKYKYKGGDNSFGTKNKPSSHNNYWKLNYGKTRLPEHVDKCVCGNNITENCYIVRGDGKALLILGNCCIKHFLGDKGGRTCDKCDKPHKNSKDNLCKKCRPKPGKTCEKCGESHKNRSDNRCNSCRLKWRKCKDCDKEIQDYLRCFNCNKSYQKEKRKDLEIADHNLHSSRRKR